MKGTSMITQSRIKVAGWFLWLLINIGVILLGVYAEVNWFNDTTQTVVVDGQEYTSGTNNNGLSIPTIFFWVAISMFGSIITAWLWLSDRYEKLPR